MDKRYYKPVERIERSCVWCGRLFTGRADKSVCSSVCRVQAWRANQSPGKRDIGRPSANQLTLAVRFSIFERDGYHCRYCGRGPDDGAKLNVDHVVPLNKGGTNAPSNLVTACFECNRGKGGRVL